jgi:hypothetical protein
MCAKSNKPKLCVELVPTTCHYSNVRSTVSKKEWDLIRNHCYEQANHTCEICGNNGLKQGFKHKVECHEIWEYDDVNHIQILKGLISLCPICHQVKHIGRAIAIGKEIQCFIQLAKVNKWTRQQIDKHILESFELHKERSKHEWTLDISLLTKAPYNLKIDLKAERIFEVKTYKKKPKKKNANGKKKIHPKAKIAAVLKPKKSKTKRPPKK